MNVSELRSVQKNYVLLALYYDKTLPDEVIRMYSEDLSDLPYDKVIGAMNSIRRQAKRRNCPLPADLRELASPDVFSDAAEANEIAGKICSAMNRYGYTNRDKAEAYIGEVGWSVVGLLGGWTHLCQSTMTADVRTLYAQARDLSKSMLEKGRRPRSETLRELSVPRHAQKGGALSSIGAVLAQLAPPK